MNARLVAVEPLNGRWRIRPDRHRGAVDMLGLAEHDRPRVNHVGNQRVCLQRDLMGAPISSDPVAMPIVSVALIVRL